MSNIELLTLEDHLALVKIAREKLTGAEDEYLAAITRCMNFKKEQAETATQAEAEAEVEVLIARAKQDDCTPVVVIDKMLLEAQTVLDVLAIPYSHYTARQYLARERVEIIICREASPICTGIRHAFCTHLGIKNFQ